MEQTECQLFKYDTEFFLVQKNSSAYFADEFSTNDLDDDYVSWLNFHDLSNKDAISRICLHLDIDTTTIDDIYENKKRAKLEESKKYLFFSIRSALSNESNGLKKALLEQEQISFVLGEKFLLSFQEKSSDHFVDVRHRIEKKKGRIRYKGPDFLLYRMLDAICDNYFEVLDDITETIEGLESKIIRNISTHTLKDIEIQKRKLIELRKIVSPLKDATMQLENIQNDLIDIENKHYFMELKNNCANVIEEIDANKQILEGLANLYHAVQGQKMNKIMKTLTIVSSIFIPLTFVAGVYGMNFDNMPELKMKYGYFFSLAFMFILGIGLFLFFWKRGWLKD